MNMQAMLQQAQKMQKEIIKSKEEIEQKLYVSKQSLVEVETKGNKEVSKINILAENLDEDDIEALEDMIMLAINENIKKINKETEEKMGKFGGAAGLF